MEATNSLGFEMEDTIFKNDVKYMKSLTGKNVVIQTVDGEIHRGAVYVIDPVYKTVLLALMDTKNLKLIPHHAIKSFEVTLGDANDEFLHAYAQGSSTDPQVISKKTALIKLFKDNNLTIKEEEDALVVGEHVRIVPPYSPESCYCNNTIILERIRDLFKLL